VLSGGFVPFVTGGVRVARLSNSARVSIGVLLTLLRLEVVPITIFKSV
jgi:hypothetical protein